MAHVRQQVRAYAKGLVIGSTLCGSRVETTRTKPIARDSEPRAFLYTVSEQSSDIDTSGNQQRQIRLKIDAVAKGDADDLQDRFDDFAVFVEKAFATDHRLGGLAAAIELRQTDFNANADGDKPFAVISLTYDVTVITHNSDPETTL